MNDTEKKNLAIIRDPNTAKNRVFVGNLPTCTREELESIFKPYAKVLGSLVQKNFGFVQFESEEIANKVAKSLTRSSFKGNTITVRNANQKKTQQNQGQGPNATNNVVTPAAIGTASAGNANSTWSQIQTNVGGGGGDEDNGYNTGYNDCEIIVVDRKNT